jgi:acyl-CoA synthetase (AMP-forming)/AMP-acid ligase II
MPFFSHMDTVGELIERNYRLRPDAGAVTFEGKTQTFRALTERAFQLANALYAMGLRRQDRVAVLAQNSPHYLEVYAACEIAGFITVTINYRLAAGEMAFILKDASPSVLVFDPDYAGLVAKLATDAPGMRCVMLGDAADDAFISYESMLQAAPATPPPLASRPDDVAYLIYTSGTTGRPKGTMLGQAAMAQSATAHAWEKGHLESDRILAVMPLYHVGAKYTQNSTHAAGAELVLHRSYNIEKVAADLQTYRIASAHLAPIMVQDLLNLPNLKDYDHSALRLINYASGPMAVALLEKAISIYGPLFMQHYGMTESGGTTALLAHDHVVNGPPQAVRRLASAGRASPGTRIKVVRGDGSECDVEEAGEVLMLSRMNMLGYWNNHAATLAAIDEDGWLHTGDIGYMDSAGYLFISDRKKDMIISGGENIYPREVEEAIYRHEAVAEAAVIGVPDPRWGEAVKAFVVLKAGAAVSESELIDHCRAHIASYKKPKQVAFVAALPRLANHKIDKKELRKDDWGGLQRGVN